MSADWQVRFFCYNFQVPKNKFLLYLKESEWRFNNRGNLGKSLKKIVELDNLQYGVIYTRPIPIIFPILIAVLALKCFDYVTDYIKIPDKYFNSTCAFTMALSIIFFSHLANYLNTRNIYIDESQHQDGISRQDSTFFIDSLFKKFSGHKGLI